MYCIPIADQLSTVLHFSGNILLPVVAVLDFEEDGSWRLMYNCTSIPCLRAL